MFTPTPSLSPPPPPPPTPPHKTNHHSNFHPGTTGNNEDLSVKLGFIWAFMPGDVCYVNEYIYAMPQYKGRGKLTCRTKCCLTSGVRCAIKMRSVEENRKEAIRKLEHNILNCVYHTFGHHENAALIFARLKEAKTHRLKQVPQILRQSQWMMQLN